MTLTNEVSFNDIISNACDVNDGIDRVKRHFTRLDEKLHKHDKLLVEDISDELCIDICDEEKRLFYCLTLIEKLRNLNGSIHNNANRVFYYEPMMNRCFWADQNKLDEACRTLGEQMQAYRDKVNFQERCDRAIDMLKENKFLSAGMFAQCFEVNCDNEYNYYIGNKKAYRKWLENLYHGTMKTISESENITVIRNAVNDQRDIEEAMNKFDEENK